MSLAMRPGGAAFSVSDPQHQSGVASRVLGPAVATAGLMLCIGLPLAWWASDNLAKGCVLATSLLAAAATPLVIARRALRRHAEVPLRQWIEEARQKTRSGNRANAVLDAVADAVVVIDPRGIIQSWNAAATAMFGRAAHVAIGRNVSMLVAEPHGRKHDEYLRRFAARGGTGMLDFPRDLIARRADGTHFPIRLTLRQVELARQPGRLLCGTIQDRSGHEEARRDLVEHANQIESKNHDLADARKQAEKALAMAEAANKSKSAFLANMSHEIRTPMTAILGYAENLQDPLLEPTEQQIAVETILRNGEHLLSIINDILDLSKIEAGKMSVEKIEFSPARLVAEVVALMRVRAASKGLRLRAVYDCPIPTVIESDPTRLRQVLINLCGNAIKFTELGSVEVRVGLVDRLKDAPRLQFSVADTGIGIDAAARQRLFKAFEQGDESTTRRFGGTGLGLDISGRLVGMLGGSIAVVSEPGKGSTFSFSIATGPLRTMQLLYGVDEEEPAPTSRVTMVQPKRVRGRILLAEDGPDNQHLICFLLRRAGAEVVVAADGASARDQALTAERSTTPFDLVLMDMQMPILDGYRATAELRRAGFHKPIVALTANAMAGDRERCLESGCSHFTQKPIDRAALYDLLAQLLPAGPATSGAPGTPAKP